MAETINRVALHEWLDLAIDQLPGKGQIVLNIDACVVGWEIKASYIGDKQQERIEIRRSGRLNLRNAD